MSEGSSVGFRPVPKKRTFLSRRTSSQSETNGQLGPDAPVKPAGVVPAPRHSLQRVPSGSSAHSCLKGKDDTPSNQRVQSVQRSVDDDSFQLLSNVSQVSNLDRETNPPSVVSDRSVNYP